MGENRFGKFSKKFALNLCEETVTLDLKGLESFCEDVSLNLNLGDIICLFGELGSGKTTFVRNLINSIYKKNKLKKPNSIKSPSFPILITYEVNKFESTTTSIILIPFLIFSFLIVIDGRSSPTEPFPKVFLAVSSAF